MLTRKTLSGLLYKALSTLSTFFYITRLKIVKWHFLGKFIRKTPWAYSTFTYMGKV